MVQLDPLTQSAQSEYHENGFHLVKRLLPDDLVHRAQTRVEAVLRGEYETGVPPRIHNNGDNPNRLRKFDQAHLSDNTIFEAATYPGIGEWASRITGRPWVQLWALQMLYKPPGGAAIGNVGWHQDRQYWKYWDEGSELFTAWVALSDVTEEAGPMRFAAGSHRWGFLDKGDFFNTNQSAPAEAPKGEKWIEVPGTLSPGGVSFHHCLTYHGSGPNLSKSPRISLALHLRTDQSRPRPGADDYYVCDLDDPRKCPVIFSK